MPIDSVQSIRWLSPGEARWRGAGEGALIVAPLGLAIGAIAGALAHHQCQPQEVFCLDVPTTEQLAITVGVLGALAGAAVGGAIGAAVGHHDELQLTSPR